jgi:hypothetical protein
VNTLTTTAAAPAFIDTPVFGVTAAPLGLRGIRFDNGEGGAAPAAPATPAGEPAAPAAPATPAQPAAPAPAAPTDGIDFDQLDPKTQAYIRSLRTEAQTTRETYEGKLTAAQTEAQKQLDAAAIALGLKQADDQPVDAQKLQAQITEATEKQTQVQRENVVLRSAATLGVNADLLLDSRAFTDSLAGVNPGDTAAIQTAVTEFVANHGDRYKATTIGGGSGTSGAGAGGDQTPTQSGNLQQAMARAIGGGK